MATQVPNTSIADGNLDFSAGQDASKIPDRVPPNAYYAGINISTKRGTLAPREGFDQKKLIFPEGGILDPLGCLHTFEDIFYSSRYQAIAPYSIGTEFYLVIVVGGVIYLVNQRTWTVAIVPIADGSILNPNTPRINWSPAGRFLVFFDFPAFPVVLEGDIAQRSNAYPFGIPVSVLGTYNQNRLFVGNIGNEFTAGDPSGNVATPDAPVTFEEVLAPAAAFFGQIFQLPTNYNNDPITAMGFLQFTDTSTGIGPLLVSTPNAIYSYQTQNPRTTWEAGSFGTMFVHDAGIVGPRALTNVNSDLWFLASDGQLRSASMSRDEQKKWSRIPVSREVQNWIKFWDKSLMSYAVLGYFNNKIITTVNPYRVPCRTTYNQYTTDVTHGGLVVIGLDNLATLSASSPPAWDGLWTGIRPMDIVTNNQRCFIMAKDPAMINGLWELDPNIHVDQAGEKQRYVRSRVYTKEYDFQDPFQNKELQTVEFCLKDVQGDFKLEVKYKPSQAANFMLWSIFNHKAPYRICGLPDGCNINGLGTHNFRELALGNPDIVGCDPITQEIYTWFRKMQLRLTMKGFYWEIPEFLLRAIVAPQPQRITQFACEELPLIELCKECDDDWVIEEFDICHKVQT